MSSNTLRGIGEERDGEGAGKVVGKKPAYDSVPIDSLNESQARPEAPPEDGHEAGPSAEATTVQVNPSPELVPDQSHPHSSVQSNVDSNVHSNVHSQVHNSVRSLDSTVPGTRSLDSSVPDGHPSAEAKVPGMAATLLGVPAPIIGGRDQGTVQGRDVHLPVEVQRMVGLHPVAGVSGEVQDVAPIAVERPERTRADPVRTALAAKVAAQQAPTEPAGKERPSQGDLTAHGPWYDRELAEGSIYEDERPNVLGRIAIGAAAAATLAVVLFAIVRLHGQRTADDESESKAMVSPPSLIAPRLSDPLQALPPAEPAPLPTTPEPSALPPGTSATAEPRPTEVAAAPTAVVKPPASSRHKVTSAEPTFEPLGPSMPGPQPGSASSFPPGGSPTSPPSPASPPSVANAAPPQAPRPQPIDTTFAPNFAPPPAATTLPARAPAAPGDRPRSKPNYDPDSTLPLTVD